MFLLIRTHTSPNSPPRRNRPLAEVEQESKQQKKTSLKLGKTKLPRIKGAILYPAMLAILLGFFFMGNRFMETQTMKGINVHIASGMEVPYLDAEEVQKILGVGEERPIIGYPISAEELAQIETDLLASPYISKAEAYKSLLGELQIEVSLRDPVGRIMNNSGNYLFVDSTGHKFPVQSGSVANVLLIRGDFEEGVVDTFACSTIESAMPLVNFIRKDAFWDAQIAEIIIQQSGEILLQPQIGNQRIEFGYPVEIEDKFQNLLDFYRQVLPERGWDHYRTINLKYRGQVVAKR